ncbi:MAG: alpha-galactosidase [Clostridiales bacterium]|nr:alpha-galactosidase [Clostridiales bacterium]
MISFNEDAKIFTLQSKGFMYQMKVLKEGHLAHLRAGHPVPDPDLSHLLRPNELPDCSETGRDKASFMDNVMLEFPCGGIGDYREPCIEVMDNAGHLACDLRYVSYSISEGKPELKGLPATFAAAEEAQTLSIKLLDNLLGLEVTLFYTVFEDLGAIARSAKATSLKDKLFIKRFLSLCLDLSSSSWDMITLSGAWARERYANRVPLHAGKQRIESSRGESSHQFNPFIALAEKGASEDSGKAFGFSFVYSGNFLAQAEISSMGMPRVVMGINPQNFTWVLEAGESFQSPEAILSYSEEGIGGMSRTLHDLYRKHLIRSPYVSKKRPVLINNWEATYFNFDTDKLLGICREAAKAGIELFVLDDGWFGKRNDDNTSLGDWYANEAKLPGGLSRLANEVNALGMKFGLWFEPEMISPESELYKEHPDWCIHIPGRSRTLARNQLVLDYSRKEVRDHIYSMVKAVLSSANIEYVKWDMNRNLSEVGNAIYAPDRQQEISHRYVLGVYDLMERLVSDFPNLLLENCSGGGARFDPGMLYYSPQIWTSDNVDPIERLKIQSGTSLAYPPSAMGAHVGDVPCHSNGRITPISTRGNVAMFGTFGFELDLTKISKEDLEQVPALIAQYHKCNDLARDGDLYRIGNIFTDNTWDAWMFVSKDKSEALLEYVQVLASSNTPSRRIQLKGLKEGFWYKNDETGMVLSAETLMHDGLDMWIKGDFSSKVIRFEKAKV